MWRNQARPGRRLQARDVISQQLPERPLAIFCISRSTSTRALINLDNILFLQNEQCVVLPVFYHYAEERLCAFAKRSLADRSNITSPKPQGLPLNIEYRLNREMFHRKRRSVER